MGAISPVPFPPAPASPHGHSPGSLKKAAREFEAQLLATLLAPLEQSFSAVPGESSPTGADNYGYLGMQALATGLANSGGLGVAALLVRQLSSTEVRGNEPGSFARSSISY